jgi:hypothetical protein
MRSAMSLFVLGTASAAGIGILLWLLAKRFRSALPRSIWASDAFASATALVMVGLTIMSIAWTITGAVQLVDDPFFAFGGAAVVDTAAFVLGARSLGKFPS